ncbi:unnamed protein product [Psylliodes chrysocephalus]|uniref:Uncharacterized protein n=1 Tax=Psylliodes chrysocephalus TaxID=3402493 RepID=A0A9P0CX77_9CUCU|nr:unnamed protein product [Psylliodes chrysocephala]
MYSLLFFRHIFTKKCSRYGMEDNGKQHQCQTRNVTCHICNRAGHYARRSFKKRCFQYINKNENKHPALKKRFKSSKVTARTNVEAEEEHVFHLDNNDDKVEFE